MAGTLTVEELENEVLDNITKASSTQTKSGTTLQTLATRYLNRAQLKIARIEDLLFDERTASTTASQQRYAFPTDIRGLFTFRLEDGLESRKLIVAMPEDIDRVVPKPDEATEGRPDWYIPYRSTNTFELFRIPDAAYTMRMRMSYWPTVLTSGSTTQTSDYTRMDDFLIQWATQLCYFWLQEYADAKEWKNQALETLRDGILEERNSIPDWVPKSKGFTSSPPSSVGEYYNDPFILNDPSIRYTQ